MTAFATKKGKRPFCCKNSQKDTKTLYVVKKTLHRQASKDRTHSKMSSHAVNAKAVLPPGTLLHEIYGETCLLQGAVNKQSRSKKGHKPQKNECLTLHKGERLKTFGIQWQVFQQALQTQYFCKRMQSIEKTPQK
ncbi:unknown [Corallococcus sp. CAG:1435]|nr:unknown [Corallococcus sp. CAG:1435]